MSDKALYIGLAGLGTVGGGLCRLLAENRDIVRKRCGREIIVKTVLVRDARKKRDAPDGANIVTDAAALVGDPQIGAVVELMGGIEDARSLIEAALENGKDVVTANKALLAEKGGEIFRLASARGRSLRYEASVAGAIPLVEIFKESMGGNRIMSIMGILNGTSNYILSEMTSKNVDFASALAQAQKLGYAEADPSLDIDGMDAAHKLIVLIRLAFGQHYPLSRLSVRGIRGMAAMDIRLAREFGFRIKLIGEAKAYEDPAGGPPRLAAGVFPALTHHTFLLARVGGSCNALRVEGNASGPLFFHGKGAGALPTAGAVLADLIAVARGEIPNNTGFALSELPQAEILDYEDWRSCFYVRVMVDDTPGVLRDISGCMAAEGVSVAQMIQKAGQDEGTVPLVFMTHETSQKAMAAALIRAEDARLLRQPPVYFRVLEKAQGD